MKDCLDKVLAITLGKTFIGLCLRDDREIYKLESLLIPAEFSSLSDLQHRKNAARCREAHKRRENWFMNEIWLKAGLPDFRQDKNWENLKDKLPTYYKNDKNLKTREFPAYPDKTSFNSALLRIHLIEGKPLASWQIWKALWAAIQQRGFYFYNWKTEPAGIESIKGNVAALEEQRTQLETDIEKLKALKKSAHGIASEEYAELLRLKQSELKAWKEEFAELTHQIKHYEELLLDNLHQEKYTYPCYLEAAKQGLWSFDTLTNKAVIKNQLDHTAEALKPGENHVPRAFRIKELKKLWAQAQVQLPELKGYDVEYFLYGETRLPFASAWNNEYKAFRGKAHYDCQGVMGQKVPRFDNRFISSCKLFPGRNACKASDPLSLQFDLLTQLKRLKYFSRDSKAVYSLSPTELKTVFEELWTGKIKEQINNNSPQLFIPYTFLQKALRKHVASFDELQNMEQLEKLKLKRSGRSHFSRLALSLMKQVLLSAPSSSCAPTDYINPSDYAQHDKPKGLTEVEVENALRRLGETWKTFDIPEYSHEMSGQLTREAAIEKLLAESNNPIVRHRLTLVHNLLNQLENGFNLKKHPPKQVFLECIGAEGGGFEGNKTRKARPKKSLSQDVINDNLKEKLKELNVEPSKTNVLKLRLLQEQQSQCPFTGEKLDEAQLQHYQIEPIVRVTEQSFTQTLGNKVLTTPDTCREKKQRTPYHWLAQALVWPEYVARVQRMYSGVQEEKKRLLTAPDAQELALKSKNGYIARVLRQLIALHFGYQEMANSEIRHIFVSDGTITKAIRKQYELNNWLLTNQEAQELNGLLNQLSDTSKQQSLEEKNIILRSVKKLNKKQLNNGKRHALNAFCLSFTSHLQKKIIQDAEPENLKISTLDNLKPQARSILNELFPKPLRRNNKELYPEATIYRYNPKHNAITIRKNLRSFLENDKDGKAIEKIADQSLRHYLKQMRQKLPNREAWENFLDPDRTANRDSKGNLLEDPYLLECRHPLFNTLVKKVEVITSELDENPTISHDGLRVAGEYKDFGSKSTKGQFKRTKQHRGQLLYQDTKGKWRVFPVYGHMKLAEARKQAKEKGPLYQDGLLFYSSALISIEKAFALSNGNLLKAGVYKLRTIKSEGIAVIESHEGTEYLVSINKITEAGLSLIR